MAEVGGRIVGEVRVSVVIPCFNRSWVIGEAIASALAQDCSLEVIVIDDGSTDGSWETIKSYGSSVRAFRTGNGGVSRARNLGIAQARGEYVRFLDSDDLLPRGAVAEHLHAAEALSSGSIAFGDAAAIRSDGTVLANSGYGFPACSPGEALPLAALLRNTMPPVLPLFPTAALKECGGFDPRFSLGEDKELAVRLSQLGYTFVRVPVTVYKVRHHEGERLSRDYGAAGYRALLVLHRHLHNLLEHSLPPSGDEATALARAAWAAGRSASREKLRDEADDLFALAQAIGCSDARDSPALLRALYAILRPYTAERLLEFGKLVWARAHYRTRRTSN